MTLLQLQKMKNCYEQGNDKGVLMDLPIKINEVFEVENFQVLPVQILEEDIVIHKSPSILEALRKLKQKFTFDYLYLDMDKVVKMDSSGIGAFLSLLYDIGKDRLYLYNVRENIRRRFYILQVEDLFHSSNTLEGATEKLTTSLHQQK